MFHGMCCDAITSYGILKKDVPLILRHKEKLADIMACNKCAAINKERSGSNRMPVKRSELKRRRIV